MLLITKCCPNIRTYSSFSIDISREIALILINNIFNLLNVESDIKLNKCLDKFIVKIDNTNKNKLKHQLQSYQIEDQSIRSFIEKSTVKDNKRVFTISYLSLTELIEINNFYYQ